ncbi:MAG: hypothetical protein ACKVKV_08755 [Dehalococcoidia bacterium]|jgi:hypothetical protein|tara:strand:+ start:3668 stop:4210 length:543 start_codon:yes stop_codon:yes gene_type:complete
MGLQYEQDNSGKERLRRAIMSPSKRTLLIALLVIVVIAVPFVLGTINTASESLGEVFGEHDLNENMELGPGDLEDEEIAPWLVSNGEIMIDATIPPEWEIGNYRFGGCSKDRLAEIADPTYRTAITDGCDSFYGIQGKYQRDCHIASSCNVKQIAKDELFVEMDRLRSAHAAAGYAWPSS